MNFLDNLNEDVRFNLEHNYFLKRYAYWKDGKDCWVDSKGKRITERMFSFILEHGKTWNNSTHLNFRESELHTVLETYKGVLAKVKAERKALLTAERAERKLYPTLSQFQFNNVMISVVEEMKYYDRYPGIGEKSVSVYANGLSYRYGTNLTFAKDEAVTKEWVFSFILDHQVYRHNTSVRKFKPKDFVSATKERIKRTFVPYHFYIGYQIEVEGKSIVVFNTYQDGFEDMKGGRLPVTFDQLGNIKVMGEVDGIGALPYLIKKFQYC